MIKPASLRAALVADLAAFAIDPQCLKLWIDRGGVHARGGPAGASLAFEYRYTLNLVVEDWVHPASLLVLAVNRWLAINQPDLLAARANQSAYTFEADVIDENTIDLSLEIPLSEAVSVTRRPDGGYDMQHRAEEDPIFPDADPLSDPAAPLAQVWWQGERLLPGPPLPENAP